MSVFIGFLIGIIAFLLFVLKSKGDEIKHLEEQLCDLRIRLTRNNEFAETYRKKELPTDSNYAIPVEEEEKDEFTPTPRRIRRSITSNIRDSHRYRDMVPRASHHYCYDDDNNIDLGLSNVVSLSNITPFNEEETKYNDNSGYGCNDDSNSYDSGSSGDSGGCDSSSD